METIKCPFCAEEIKIEAVKCKHCGEFLQTENQSNVGIPDTAESESHYKNTAIDEENDNSIGGGGKKISIAIFGALIGIPLSYYFQPELVRAKIGGMSGYLGNFGEIITNSDLVGNIILSVIIFALVGFFIGYIIDSYEDKSAK